MDNRLKERNALKAKKPTFTRSDSHKKKRLGQAWRRPRGLQSKVRLEKKGYVRPVKIGWGSPSTVKGLLRDGTEAIIVENVSDLEKVKGEKQAAIIASGVGIRKKIEIIKIATEKKIKLLNIKDPEGFIKKVVDRQKEKQQQKHKLAEEKKKKAKEKSEKAKKKESEDKDDTPLDDIDKKKAEKKELDKVLTTKEK